MTPVERANAITFPTDQGFQLTTFHPELLSGVVVIRLSEAWAIFQTNPFISPLCVMWQNRPCCPDRPTLLEATAQPKPRTPRPSSAILFGPQCLSSISPGR